MPYTGPIIDAHHHLWDDVAGQIPWLDGDAALRASGVVAAHEAVLGAGLAGTVWIEAVAGDPEAELVRAEAVRVAREGRLCTVLIAHADLDAPDLPARLDRLQAISPALRGIRDIVAYQPGAPSFARAPDLLDRPGFARGLAELARRGLCFDLMLRPRQMARAAELLEQVPGLTVALEHCGTPHDRTADGLRTWGEGISRLAALPGCHVKVSALHCLFDVPTDRDMAGVVERLRRAFGAQRMAFGTDWPGHDRHCPAPEALALMKRVTRDWPAMAQRSLFHDTARRLYRF